MQKKVNRFTTLTKEQSLLEIKKYLKEQHDLLIREMLSKESFESPAWSEYQAYLLGGLKVISKLNEYIPDQGA